MHISDGITVLMAGVGPVRLAEHDPGFGFGQCVGIAVHGLAVEGDGGKGDDRGDFQLEELPAGSRQGLLDGSLSEDAVTEPTEPGDGIAAPLDDVAEQRVVGAVADAEESLEVRQSDELGGAGRDGNGDGHAALLIVSRGTSPTTSFPH